MKNAENTAACKEEHWFITGAAGLLGTGLIDYLLSKGVRITALVRTHEIAIQNHNVIQKTCDLTDEERLKEILEDTSPDIIIHAAGLTNVDACEDSPEMAKLLNVRTSVWLADYALENKIFYVFISSDHVTAGRKAYFSEEDSVMPLNVYAKTKREAEINVLSANPQALVIRTNFFAKGLEWRHSLTDWLWGKLSVGETVNAFEDSYFTPISVPFLSRAIYDLYKKSAMGVYNIGSKNRLSKYDFARRFCDVFGLDHSLVNPSSVESAGLKAPRPIDMSMDVSKAEQFLGYEMPTVEESLISVRQEYMEADGQ